MLRLVAEPGEILYTAASHHSRNSLLSPAENEFTALEAKESILIPFSLKAFLKATAGGCNIWPNVLEALPFPVSPTPLPLPKEDKPEYDFVERMATWDEIIEESDIDAAEASRVCPPDMLAIGYTNWNWRILIVHQGLGVGSIYRCPYSPHSRWDETVKIKVADSLPEFFHLLTEDAMQKGTYQSQWSSALQDGRPVKHFRIADIAQPGGAADADNGRR